MRNVTFKIISTKLETHHLNWIGISNESHSLIKFIWGRKKNNSFNIFFLFNGLFFIASILISRCCNFLSGKIRFNEFKIHICTQRWFSLCMCLSQIAPEIVPILVQLIDFEIDLRIAFSDDSSYIIFFFSSFLFSVELFCTYIFLFILIYFVLALLNVYKIKRSLCFI